MRYQLSKIIPIHFRSVYQCASCAEAHEPHAITQVAWWQWRDRIFSHHERIVDKSNAWRGDT